MSARPRCEALTRLAALGVVALFFAVRLTLLVVREPFFDELFTSWMASRPFASILSALQLDSGPPLYYFVARFENVFALRALSLLFATATLALIVSRASLGTGRWTAAALLAVYPPAALFAVDARAYALCGLFVAIGVVAVHEKRPFLAALGFVLAAYTHWYGALFLPLVLLAKPLRRAVIAAAVAAVAFVPGLLLAARQPPEATAWLGEQHPLAALNVFAFTGAYAEALFRPAPMLLIVLSGIALVASISRAGTFALMVLVPVLLAIAFSLAGRTVYFPMRFESVLAAPLVLWIARSLQWWRRELRFVLAFTLGVCGVIVLVRGAVDHQRRPLDPYRQAAIVLRERAAPDERVVASGFLFLEAVHQLGADRVRPYPSEQGRHPGWRVSGVPNEPLPEGPFLWIGERAAPELARIGRRDARLLHANERAFVARVR